MPTKYNLKFSNYTVGIDEVGRGPIAGPLLVAAVCVPKKYRRQMSILFRGIKDSKQLSEKSREEWFAKLKMAREQGLIDWRTSFMTPKVLDREGISNAARTCVRRVLSRLECPPEKTNVLLDGGLYAPRRFVYQKTIVRGEEKERLIAAASIVAKVNRDRRMRNYSERFPEYGFEKHKGYGTNAHILAVRKHGLCPLHRRTFLTNYIT